MTAPLVSVVIPTYNRADFLIETIESVLKQTFTDYEVIVVDDGCTDDTVARLQPFAERIRIVSQPNGGIGVARNRGIDEARGKYVALLDHDDWWQPEKLAVQTEFLESRPTFIGAAVVYANSPLPDKPVVCPADIADADGKVRHPLQTLAKIPFMGTSSFMFVRERAQGVRYGVVRGAIEDIQFMIGIIMCGAVGIVGDRPLAIWREHGENYSHRSSYYYSGQKVLRAMDAQGKFAGIRDEDRRDLREFLGSCGRVCVMRQLPFHKRDGWALYRFEFLPQLRLGRIRFLLAYPILLILPAAIFGKIYKIRKAQKPHETLQGDRCP